MLARRKHPAPLAGRPILIARKGPFEVDGRRRNGGEALAHGLTRVVNETLTGGHCAVPVRTVCPLREHRAAGPDLVEKDTIEVGIGEGRCPAGREGVGALGQVAGLDVAVDAGAAGPGSSQLRTQRRNFGISGVDDHRADVADAGEKPFPLCIIGEIRGHTQLGPFGDAISGVGVESRTGGMGRINIGWVDDGRQSWCWARWGAGHDERSRPRTDYRREFGRARASIGKNPIQSGPLIIAGPCHHAQRQPSEGAFAFRLDSKGKVLHVGVGRGIATRARVGPIDRLGPRGGAQDDVLERLQSSQDIRPSRIHVAVHQLIDSVDLDRAQSGGGRGKMALSDNQSAEDRRRGQGQRNASAGAVPRRGLVVHENVPRGVERKGWVNQSCCCRSPSASRVCARDRTKFWPS